MAINIEDEYWADMIKEIAECSLKLLDKLELQLTSSQGAEIEGMREDLQLIINIVNEVIDEPSRTSESDM